MQVIIYVQDNGIPAMVAPSGEIDIAQVALKDVPFGKPYKIVDDSTLPPVDEFYEAWTADMSNPDGTGIGAQRWFMQKYDEATATLTQRLSDLTSTLSTLVVPAEEDEEGLVSYNQDRTDLNRYIDETRQSLADLVEMRKVQSDELFKFEGVRL